ncbi:DMT family transporter [Phyllobacterium leguminum]|uniref:Threonine/homoserine efflux transporter RhtA n=1 Tax=Phyllobacterium leguminum TaxID=314237 RepID=A0A318STF9_9HYPH|nr:DMT family transporter [Phyllobacterium leguminum]PYE85130.1 threonine/homoserine efflux transporter RhtA [Phyllobacterium leguminum]
MTSTKSNSAAPDRNITPSFKAWAVLVAGAISLGTAPLLVKGMTLPAESSAFFRVLLSAPVFLALTFWMGVRNAKPNNAGLNKDVPTYLYILAAFFFAADLLTMHVAIRAINTSIATLLTNAAPIFVAIYGIMGFTDRPDSRFGAALPLALVGMVLLFGLAAFDRTAPIWGYFVALGAGAFYAAYLTTVRTLKQHGAATTRIMAWVTVCSALFLSPLILTQEFKIPEGTDDILRVLALVLFGQLIGQGLVTNALRDLPVSASSIVLMIQPIFVAFAAWPLLGEALSSLQILGMTMVLVSIWMVVPPWRRNHRSPELASNRIVSAYPGNEAESIKLQANKRA